MTSYKALLTFNCTTVQSIYSSTISNVGMAVTIGGILDLLNVDNVNFVY